MKFVVYFIYKSLPLDQDGAEPCPNSVSVTNLVRLGTLLHRQDYLEKAGTIVKVFYERLTKIPVAVPEMVCGLILLQDTPKQVIYLICQVMENIQQKAQISKFMQNVLKIRFDYNYYNYYDYNFK